MHTYMYNYVQYLTLLSITVLPLTIVYFVSEVTVLQMYYTVLHLSTMLYLTLLSVHTITVLPLTIVYFVSEVTVL